MINSERLLLTPAGAHHFTRSYTPKRLPTPPLENNITQIISSPATVGQTLGHKYFDFVCQSWPECVVSLILGNPARYKNIHTYISEHRITCISILYSRQIREDERFIEINVSIVIIECGKNIRIDKLTSFVNAVKM